MEKRPKTLPAKGGARKTKAKTAASTAASSGSSSLFVVVAILGIVLAAGAYLYQTGHLKPYLATVEEMLATKGTTNEAKQGAKQEPVKKEAKSAPSEETEAPAKPKKPKKPARLLQQSVGAQEPDYAIRQEIRAADRLLTKNKARDALNEFRRLNENKGSIRSKYGEAAALHVLSDEQRSNDLVQESISAYANVCKWSGGRRNVRIAGCLQMSARMSFMGKSRGAVKLMEGVLQDLGENVKILEEIGLQCLISGMNDKAKTALLRLVELDPENGFGLGHLGFVYKLELHYEKAVPLMFAGLRGNDDRSRESRFYYHLGDALMRLNRSEEAYQVYAEGAEKGNFNSMFQRSTYNAPNLKAQPWWDPEDTPYLKDVKRIEKMWKTIRDEGLSVMKLDRGGFDKEEENLRKEGDWGQFTLFQQGHVFEENCRKAPKTCKLFKSIKDSSGCKRGQVKFSVMQPGTVVWPHCGPTNCRLRFHLGLVVPDDVHIRCGNETRTWTEGKTIVFDDSFEHEVWHHGKSFRMVLIMDFWHPDLSERQKHELSPI